HRFTTHSDSSRLGGAIALQHTRTLVGWVERSLYTKHSARLGVIKFLWSLRSSHNLLLVRSLWVHITLAIVNLSVIIQGEIV
ncbi:MAG: hypothetical protein P5680_26150, partial [Limnospira sp. PMC 737.11]|uniref:hypothetical protein n=1 Tax=Limnospira sp. PMC 737.11 TaxID=2981095 RepID=UPI0028E15E69